MLDSLIRVLLLIFFGGSSRRRNRRRRWWAQNDDSDYSMLNPCILSPPEEPLSIFPREESHNPSPAPEPDFKILGIDLDTHPGSIDFGSGGLLDGGISDSGSTFDSGSVFDNSSFFDSSGFGGGGDFGGGGAGGDWGNSGSDGSS